MIALQYLFNNWKNPTTKNHGMEQIFAVQSVGYHWNRSVGDHPPNVIIFGKLPCIVRIGNILFAED